MPTPALLLVVAAILPLVGFLLLLFAGRRLGNPVGGWVATLLLLCSFACSLGAMVGWFNADPGHFAGTEWGEQDGPLSIPIHWIPNSLDGSSKFSAAGHAAGLNFDIYIDSLTILLFAAVTSVAVLAHMFSIGYLRDDPRFIRFHQATLLLIFAMLWLVLAGTLVQWLIGWELLSVSGYLLVSFWYESRLSVQAAINSTLLLAAGDLSFLIGFGILFAYLGNATLPELWTYLGPANAGGGIALPGGMQITGGWLTGAGICLLIGALARCGQFPFQTWLADSAHAPSPAGALLQSITTVASGVYVVARLFPILTPTARTFLAVIGLITLTTGALAATAQTNIKRLLAYSTVSQAGYMILALGVGGWIAGVFHLMTHAFVKTLLILAAGNVIHWLGGEADLRQFGGLARRMPLTAVAFGLGALVLAGTPYLSASLSNVMILNDTAGFILASHDGGKPPAYALFFFLPAAMSVLTAFYLTRCWMLTFWGRPRNPERTSKARDYPGMWGPLLGLTVLSLLSGRFLLIQPLIEASIKETQAVCHDVQVRDPFFQNRPDFDPFARDWPSSAFAGQDDYASATLAAGQELRFRWLRYSTLIGIVAAVVIYVRGFMITDWLLRLPLIRIFYRWLQHGMNIDALFLMLLAPLVWFIARLVAWFDRRWVDRTFERTGDCIVDLSAMVAPRAVGENDSGIAAIALGRRASLLLWPLILAAVALSAAIAYLQWHS